MKFTIITPNRNGERYLETAIRSVLSQRDTGIEVEYIVADGASTDRSLAILERYRDQIDWITSEPDNGPASAINKGLRRATGDVVAWLNADDMYYPGALQRVARALESRPDAALGFGRCRIVDEENQEIRRGITRFKEAFFPISTRFTIQCINYVSQPAMFFRRTAMERTGLLREDLKAAWDYEFLLRLWRQGGATRIAGSPLAAFRWHASSISGTQFRRQFKEEYEAAAADAGRFAPQTLLHRGVRAGIVGIYSWMDRRRRIHARRD
jgi:glycosyltransferase involved in cell wall biosynthesis